MKTWVFKFRVLSFIVIAILCAMHVYIARATSTPEPLQIFLIRYRNTTNAYYMARHSPSVDYTWDQETDSINILSGNAGSIDLSVECGPHIVFYWISQADKFYIVEAKNHIDWEPYSAKIKGSGILSYYKVAINASNTYQLFRIKQL